MPVQSRTLDNVLLIWRKLKKKALTWENVPFNKSLYFFIFKNQVIEMIFYIQKTGI